MLDEDVDVCWLLHLTGLANSFIFASWQCALVLEFIALYYCLSLYTTVT